MRRDLYADNAEVKALLEKGDALVNLTQNVDFVNYSSNFCPCLLTKSFVWSLRQGRQLLWQELFNSARSVPNQYRPQWHANHSFGGQWLIPAAEIEQLKKKHMNVAYCIQDR